MGKIRVKSFGDQEKEEKDKRLTAKRQAQKEEKNAAKAAESVTESAPQPYTAKPEEATSQEGSTEEQKTEKKAKKKEFKSRGKEVSRSQNYSSKYSLINHDELYAVKDALDLLDKAHMAKFDETVELHINTVSTGISGQVSLPHGSGKTTKVAIADDAIIAEIEKGKINFDILVAHPSMMPQLAKVAKVLGPRGLMPNPKSGTVTPNPEEVAKKFAGGAMNFKTEAKAPIIHMIVGKLSFGPEKLTENISSAFTAVKKSNIVNVTLKSSMSPGIKLKV